MRMSEFDRLPAADARAALVECCAAPQWVERLVAGRPYGAVDALLARADEVLADLDERQVDLALAAHPRIGEHVGERQASGGRPASELAEPAGWLGTAHTSSVREQAGVAAAGEDVRAELAAGNRAYEERFGHVYLVRAAGRSADELLAILRARLANDPATERAVLRGELAEINRIRLGRMVADR